MMLEWFKDVMIVARMTLKFLPPIESIVFIDSLVHIQLYHYNHNQQKKRHLWLRCWIPFIKLSGNFLFIILQNRRWMICIKEDYGLVMNMCLVYLMELTLCMFLARMILFMLQTADHKKRKGYNAKSKYWKPAKYIPKTLIMLL